MIVIALNSLFCINYVHRIFQFENFKRTKKRVMEEDEVDGAQVYNTLVTVEPTMR